MRSWITDGADGFGANNLPYGVFSLPGDDRHRVGVAIGDRVLDVAPLAGADGVAADELAAPSLDGLLAAGRQTWSQVRGWLSELVTEESRRIDVQAHLHSRADAELHLPFTVADYVDFYSSEHHASNVGAIFRPEQQPLTPNWKHLPIGYHGRAGTVVVSGTPVVRPQGQRKPADAQRPDLGPSRRLDIEAEVGFVVGTPSRLGERVPVTDFREHVFGVCLVNDWSARDIQAFEYVPLGPFLGKSFATSVSPWIVPLDALGAAWVDAPPREPAVLPYLEEATPGGLDLTLEVRLNGEIVSRPPFAQMYWTAAQQLAHLTVNGASLRTGDLYASGTVSGPEPGQRGSFLELSWGGRDPLTLADGSSRTFLADGDEVIVSATAPGPDGTLIGFGDVRGTVLAAQ